MYGSSVKTRLSYKDGKATMDQFEVSVDGYSDRKALDEAKKSYNSGKEIKENHNEEKIESLFYIMYRDFLRRLYRWRSL